MLKHFKANKVKWIIIFFALLLLADASLSLVNLFIVDYLEQTFGIQQRLVSISILITILIILISLLVGNFKWISNKLKTPKVRKL
jgi:hypothetical protein